MWRYLGRTGFCAALAVVSIGVAHAQEGQLVSYSSRIVEVSHGVLADIRPQLDDHSREIIDSVVIEAPESWITNASAERTNHVRRVVEFNAGLLAATDWLALAMIAEHEGFKGCLEEYSGYLVRIARRNSRHALRGIERGTVADFDQYARTSRGFCKDATATPLSDENKQFREHMLDGVIATVVLHEVAHHVLGHVESTQKGLVLAHMRETAADRWAIRAAFDANYDLRPAVPLFLFLAASGGGSIEDDIRSTHPSGLRRIRDLLVQTRELLDNKDPIGAHVMDVSIDELNRSLAW
jgi:hypothetical protein